MSDFANEWHSWLALDEKWLPRLTASLSKIEIDGHLQKMNWSEQIEYLVPCWVEKLTELSQSSIKKVIKSKNAYIACNQKYNDKHSYTQFEKVTKFPDKKLQYLIVVLFLAGVSASTDELMEVFSFRDKYFFIKNYVKPLESIGFISKTNPDKPTASNQKYVITEKGRRFLTGQDF
jgi:hypothetical protein